MTKRRQAWVIWLLCVGVAILLGFLEHWSGFACWLQIGILLIAVPIEWFFCVWLPRWYLASLPPAELERRLAEMTPKKREEALHWIESHDA